MNNVSRDFPLSRVCVTRTCLEFLTANCHDPLYFITRHALGDWGDLCEADKRENYQAAQFGRRILSRYNLVEGEALYCITEADRSVTTLMMVQDY